MESGWLSFATSDFIKRNGDKKLLRNTNQYLEKYISFWRQMPLFSFQQDAALAAYLGYAGQLHLGSPVWDDHGLLQGDSPALHRWDEQDVHPGHFQLEEHPGDVRESTEDQLGGESPYSYLLSIAVPLILLPWRCPSLFSGTNQGLKWTSPCCMERTRGASADFV